MKSLPVTVTRYCANFDKKPDVGDKHEFEGAYYIVVSINYESNAVVYGQIPANRLNRQKGVSDEEINKLKDRIVELERERDKRDIEQKINGAFWLAAWHTRKLYAYRNGFICLDAGLTELQEQLRKGGK